MLIQESSLTWLSAAAIFDSEEEDLGKSLENEGDYICKRLSTNPAVPGRLCRDPKYAEFYRDVLKADDEVIKIVKNCYLIPLDTGPPAINKNNQLLKKQKVCHPRTQEAGKSTMCRGSEQACLLMKRILI